MRNQTDVYEKITISIIEAIEADCGKFEMPWHTFSSLPSNAANKRRYRGINVLALWAAANRHGYKAQLWATYQQWRELGAQVRQGEKSTAVVFWKFYGDDSEDESDSPESGNTSDSRRRCFARAYHVFNADQVEGFSIPEMPTFTGSAAYSTGRRFLPPHRSADRRDRHARVLRLKRRRNPYAAVFIFQESRLLLLDARP